MFNVMYLFIQLYSYFDLIDKVQQIGMTILLWHEQCTLFSCNRESHRSEPERKAEGYCTVVTVK